VFYYSNDAQGSLLFTQPTGTGISGATKKPIDIDDDDWNIETDTDEWWRPTLEKHGEEVVKLVDNGNKVVLLLHILAYAQQAGDKVVIFSNSLPTLDYLEYVLALDWKEHVPSLSSVSPNAPLGRWQKAKEYVRIDGSVSGAERGDLVGQFEDDIDVKAFLISKAGGIGINLVRIWSGSKSH
jgi:SNF2 family DNA or RNA helicase